MGGGTTVVEGSRLGMQMYGNDLNPVAWFVVKNELAQVNKAEVEKLLADIDQAVQKIADEAYAVALGHIENNREAIDRITEVLVEKETISGDEFRALLAEHTSIPAENLKALEASASI